MSTILCFGDSNTFGSHPLTWTRHDRHTRWPGVLRDQLGPDFWVIEEGHPGRTSVHDDPFEDQRNGLACLRPLLESHQPDLVILLIGTNDLKQRFGLSAWGIAAGAGKLAGIIRTAAVTSSGTSPQVILVCPPPIIETGAFADMFEGGAEKSLKMAVHYQAFAKETGSHFVDAGTIIQSCPSEGIHWEAAEHHKLGLALAAKVREVLVATQQAGQA